VIAPPGAVELKEGSTSLFVPMEHSIKGPGKRVGRVFYNQQMAFNRDISVLFFQAACMECRSAFDAMSATGARGVRILNESGSKAQFVMNDKDSEAVSFIKANIELNGLEGACASQDDLRSHLAKHVYDYVDLDPFGTPAPFVQAVFQGCKRNAIVAITATDTAPLAGTHVKKCVRRYMARPLRGVFGHEVGLRVLIGYLAREAAQLDKGIEPLLSFYADHYFRIYLRLKENAAAAEHSLSHLGYLTFDRETLAREVSREFNPEAAGPLWIAPGQHDRGRFAGASGAMHQVPQPLEERAGRSLFLREQRAFIFPAQLSARAREAARPYPQAWEGLAHALLPQWVQDRSASEGTARPLSRGKLNPPNSLSIGWRMRSAVKG
jgi:tRNA (guanine26-N2/guanine27-N2)-dimethyltransferase